MNNADRIAVLEALVKRLVRSQVFSRPFEGATDNINANKKEERIQRIYEEAVQEALGQGR